MFNTLKRAHYLVSPYDSIHYQLKQIGCENKEVINLMYHQISKGISVPKARRKYYG